MKKEIPDGTTSASDPGLLDEREMYELLDFMEEKITEAVDAHEKGKMAPLGFVSACRQKGVLYDMFVASRAKFPAFDEQCRIIEEQIKRLPGERALGIAMGSPKPNLGEVTALAGRMDPDTFGEKKVNDAPLVLLLGKMEPEAIDAEILDSTKMLDSVRKSTARKALPE